MVYKCEMRAGCLLGLVVVLVSCGEVTPTAAPPVVPPGPPVAASASSAPEPPAVPPPPEVLASDTQKTTTEGTTFFAPAGWSLTVRGAATILEAPEHDSRIVLFDGPAKDADAAVAAAWAAYKPDAKWPLKVATSRPDRDGWSEIRHYEYQTSPNEMRDVDAEARHAGGVWTTIIYDSCFAIL